MPSVTSAPFVPDSAAATEVVPSPNHGERRGNSRPDMLLLHYTGMPDAEAALRRLCQQDSEVSAHYVVFENGRIVQCVPEARRAWHAGQAEWAGADDINSCSIGIEITNPGHQWGYADFPEPQIAAVIALCRDNPNIADVLLTTEEEGVGLLAGAALGGERAALLMQSSGVGNCINMLSLATISRFPLLMLVTMRGEWAEFNPWQVPMSQATEPVLTAMGVKCYRADRPEDVADIAQAAAELAFGGDFAVAVLLSQKLIGRKMWVK